MKISSDTDSANLKTMCLLIKFTKRLSGCNSLTYTERRNKLNLTTLELRKLYYDLVMCYKIVFNIVQLDFSEFFARNTYTRTSTRGHP